MKTHNKLSESLGLSEYESKIYIALQNNGPLHIKNIGKFSGLPRTAVYSPLLNLQKNGFISETVFGKRKYYSATPLKNLKSIFEQKRLLMEDAISEISESKQITSAESNLETTFFIGDQGIKSAGLIFLDETKEKTWYSFENLTKVTDSVGFDFEDFYIKERIKRGIKSKMILSITDESTVIRKILKQDREQLRETLLLSPNQYPFDTTIVATEKIVLLINPTDNKFALLIRNKNMADTFIQIHKCIWDRYKKYGIVDKIL